MTRRVLSAAVLALVGHLTFGLDNGLGALPPMGWNSWNLAGCKINESFFRATVEQLAEGGFREAGYEYINLDDCWMSTTRTPEGDLQWGPNFPTGSTLGDFVHSKGFKFGMYLSAGPKTCSLRDPNNRSATGWGSYGYEERDAAWIAKQGADYLKYDAVCGGDYNAPPLNTSFSLMDWERVVVSKMGVALNKTGRQIWYQYGSPYTWNRHGGMCGGGSSSWITQNASLGGVNSFRSGFDMSDSWGNVGEQIGGVVKWNEAIQGQRCAGSCPWPDADCLEIGNNISNINVVESQSYFSWYAIANAPLLMSTRIDTLDPRLRAILLQPEVIAVNQDYAGVRGGPATPPLAKNTGLVWAKPLTASATAANQASMDGLEAAGAAAFLLGGNSPNVTLWFRDIGFDTTTPALVRDLVLRKDLGTFVGSITVALQPSESRLYKVIPHKM